MDPFEEMKAYIRFDDEDGRRLADFWPTVRPRLREVSDVFYDRILEFESARMVFEDSRQVMRLKRTLEVWLEELLTGPHDHAYYERRRRIGDKHVKVGLPHRYMYTAMQVVQDHLCRMAEETHDLHSASRICLSLRRVTMLDLAIMTGTYMGERERHRMGDLASLLVSHLRSATFLLDLEGRVTVVTESARSLCGREPTGSPFLAVLPAEIAVAADLEQALVVAGQRGTEIEVPRVDVEIDGVQRSFRVQVNGIRSGAIGVMVVIDELTEMLASEAQLRRTEALAQIGSMSAAVAHELRNPLAGISGAIQVLATSMEADDRRRAIMGKVRDQIRRLDRMVHDLLAFARTPEARLRVVDLAEVADVVCEHAQRDAGGAKVVRVGEGTAYADADLVHRIALNLVQNALAASHATGRVEVHVANGRLVVCDDGPGIPEDIGNKVFEPFYTTKTTGTGLGLAICRNAAEAMGATLQLSQGPLPGAAFSLVFTEQGPLHR